MFISSLIITIFMINYNYTTHLRQYYPTPAGKKLSSEHFK